jgi:hypothetical protein
LSKASNQFIQPELGEFLRSGVRSYLVPASFVVVFIEFPPQVILLYLFSMVIIR